LAHYAQRAAANGIPLQPLTAAEIHHLEPAVHALAGLYSPATGILDSHGFMLALLGEAEQAGALLVTRTPVIGGRITARGILLEMGGDAPFTVQSRLVVNAAGLFAQDVARRIEGFPAAAIPPTFYAKGHYFTLSGRAPFQHLVYPMPDHAGLGIHATLDLGGQCKFGPDVSGWSETPDYAFEKGLEAKFHQAIRRYYPDLVEGALQPGYVGVRPKISGPTEAAADFCIQGPGTHGVAGWVNLFGIESPGLTATLAIAREVAQQLGVSED
jgi:L-2-hydroxyglutarate oxidase LhgO